MENKNSITNNDDLDLDWSALSIYYYPFKSKKLVTSNKNSYFFYPTIFVFFIPVLFFLLFMAIIPNFSKNFDLIDFSILTIASIFLIIGLWFLYKDLKPIVFSKTSNLFWIGYKKPPIASPQNHAYELHEILAVQVLWKEIKYQFHQGFAYELNIVLSDMTRVHLFSVSDPKPLLKEAEILAKFLNVPLYYRT